MVHSMKMGWMKTPSQRKKELEEKNDEDDHYYDLWSNEDEVSLVCVELSSQANISPCGPVMVLGEETLSHFIHILYNIHNNIYLSYLIHTRDCLSIQLPNSL